MNPVDINPLQGGHAVYPGTFHPATQAHLAVAQAALKLPTISTVTFTLSESGIDKEHLEDPYERAEDLRSLLTTHSNLRVAVTRHRLIADIAEGYDLVIVGADKWHQMQDVRYYNNDSQERNAALGRLPSVAVVPRSGLAVPEHLLMGIDARYRDVSSTEVRSGDETWLLRTEVLPSAPGIQEDRNLPEL